MLQQSASGLGIDQNLQRHRAVSLRQHGFLVSHIVAIAARRNVESYSELPVNQSEVDAMYGGTSTYTVGPLLTRQDNVGCAIEPSDNNMKSTTSYSAATDSSEDMFGPSDCDTARDDEVQPAAAHSAVGTFAADARSQG